MYRTILFGLVIASCNNPPPPPRESDNSTALDKIDKQISGDRARVETRLQDHQNGIEDAFTAGDCQTIALKRAAVEKRENYTPPLQSELMADEVRVGHRRLEEYDNRARELGCELEDCAAFIYIYPGDSPAAQTIRGTTSKDSQTVCYRVRNTLGKQLLSVKVSARATKPGIGVHVEPTTGIGVGDGDIVTLEASSGMAFAIWSMETGDDGADPEGGWKAVPFTLTVTPVLRHALTKQAPSPAMTKVK